MTATEKPQLSRIEKLFLRLPTVQADIKSRLGAIEAERREDRKALEAVRARRDGPEFAKLTKAHAKTMDAVAAAETELAAARQRVLQAYYAVTEHSHTCDAEMVRIEARIREKANPSIGDFIEQLYREFNAAANMSSNTSLQFAGTVQSRLEGLRAAIDAASALRLAVDVNVDAELARIRATVPVIAMPRDEENLDAEKKRAEVRALDFIAEAVSHN